MATVTIRVMAAASIDLRNNSHISCGNPHFRVKPGESSNKVRSPKKPAAPLLYYVFESLYIFYMKLLNRVRFSSLVILAVCMICGCATLPNVSEILQEVPADGRTPEIVGARGPLRPTASKAIMRKIKRFSGVSDIVERQTLALEAVSGKPLISGNKATLLIDGPATYASMLETIRKAKDNVNFETYIFEDDETGRIFAHEFLKKQAEGVQVNIIYDSFGSMGTPREFFQNLRDHGIKVLEFNPVNPLRALIRWRLARRDHRKLLIVDGKTGFTGGVNISRRYSYGLSGILHRHKKKEMEEKGEPWRDTHVRIDGPAVAEFQKLFLDTWKDMGGTELPRRDYFPQLKDEGTDLVQVIGSTPGEFNRLTFIMYVAAFLNAQQSIHLTTPYFVPDKQAVSALIDAARRGVDVKIVLPEAGDHFLVLYAGHYYYSDLLKAGVKLYERKHRMIHAKTSVVDGVWSTVGSTNMDLWSFLHNNEVNAIIVSDRFSLEMEALFRKDLARSHEVTPDEWKRRPLFPRIIEWVAHLFRRYL